MTGEFSPLILPNSQPVNSNAPSYRKSVVAVVGAALVVTIILGLSLQTKSPSTLSFSSSTSSSLAIVLSNEEYEGKAITSTSDYPWITSGLVAEPHRVTTLRVHAPVEGDTYSWSIDGELVGKGSSITHTFRNVGTCSVRLYSSSSSTAAEHTIFVRYVRREVRRLTDGDREATLDAMQKLWTVDGERGRDLYGEQFASTAELAEAHALMAGAKLCDHIHDGLGFLTQHLGLSMRFEEALQAVQPMSALPYWDFTIDSHMVASGAWSMLDESPLWTAKWFGATNEADGAIKDGRWARAQVPRGAAIQNSYGFLRAPWNSNNRPHVTRSPGHAMCGLIDDGASSNYATAGVGGNADTLLEKGHDSSDSANLPSCEDHQAALKNYDTWFGFAWNLPYAPHGSVHEFIGGTLDCDETFARVEDVLQEAREEDGYSSISAKNDARTTADTLRSIAFAMLKNGWRRGFLEMPSGSCSATTPFKACKATCVGLDSAESAAEGDDDEATGADALSQWDADDLLKQIGGYDALSSFPSSARKKALRQICQGGFAVEGDSLSAASPFDPSFWVIHPTVERLWMWKKLQKKGSSTRFEPFKDEAWPQKGSAQTTGCTGHAAHDAVPFYKKEGGAYYTNQELYDLADPTSETGLKYIYEDFHWDHCIAAGFPLR